MFKNNKIKIIAIVFLLAFILVFTFPSTIFADQTTDVSSFVTRLYNTCLDRGPDPAGLDNWVNNLLSGKMTGGQVAYGFVFSDELKNRNLNNDQFLVVMYKAFFDRTADTGGYNTWMGLLNGGSSREYVFSNFVNSTEFANLCAKYGIQAGTLSVANTVTTSPETGSATLGEKNAALKALDYLAYTSFSYSGLVEQLKFEGYTQEEAVYGVDRCGADWNKQAALKAKQYLDYTSFSRDGLIAQLEFEGFTRQQAEYGVQAVGY
jgi:Host cell surface-exposed lipoprotein.